MTAYDDTNTGVLFQPHPDQQFAGQGKINIEGAESKYVMVKERLTRDGDPVLVVYKRAGVLFNNDKRDNDKAPDYSGPLDDRPDYRLAAWRGNKDGRNYLSLKVGPKTQAASEQAATSPKTSTYNDDIPF